MKGGIGVFARGTFQTQLFRGEKQKRGDPRVFDKGLIWSFAPTNNKIRALTARFKLIQKP